MAWVLALVLASKAMQLLAWAPVWARARATKAQLELAATLAPVELQATQVQEQA